MTTQERIADILAGIIVGLVFMVLGLWLLTWTVPAVADGSWRWYHLALMALAIRLVSFQPTFRK